MNRVLQRLVEKYVGAGKYSIDDRAKILHDEHSKNMFLIWVRQHELSQRMHDGLNWTEYDYAKTVED